MLLYYHGTNSVSAASIIKKIRVCSFPRKFKAELGDGFYVGSSCWRASAWAWHKAKRDYKVVQFNIPEIPFLKLDVRIMNRKEIEKFWKDKIKTSLDCDAAWGPIVGGHIRDTLQIKFESQQGINFINKTYKVIL